jgi:hypothetical protein
MTPQSAGSQEAQISNRLVLVERELRQAQRAFLRASASGKLPCDEQIELLDSIEHSLEASRVRRSRHLPIRPEETEVPLALLRHISYSAQYFQNLG